MNFDVTSDIDISKYHLEKNINRFIDIFMFMKIKIFKLAIFFSKVKHYFYF